MATHNLPKHADFAKDVIIDADGDTLAFHRPPPPGAEIPGGKTSGQILEPVCDADLQEADSGSHYGSESLVTVFARMVWQHVKLACWLTVGLGIVMMIFSANSKKSAPFQSHPIQWIFQLIVGLIGLPLLLIVIFAEWLYDGHRAVFNLGLFAIYLVWLFINGWMVVGDEYWVKHGTRVRRQVWMADIWGPAYESKPQLQQAGNEYLNALGKDLTTFSREGGNKEYSFSKEGFYAEMMASRDRLGRIFFFSDTHQVADLPVEYTDAEHWKLVKVALLPWLLAAALVLAAIPWHGAADAACYHGCSAEEAYAAAVATPAPEGAIGKHELSGKVTVVAGGYAGGGMLECSPDFKGSGTRSRWPEDGTYRVERLDYNGFPSARGNYLRFKEFSLLGDGVVGVCRDTRP